MPSRPSPVTDEDRLLFILFGLDVFAYWSFKLTLAFTSNHAPGISAVWATIGSVTPWVHSTIFILLSTILMTIFVPKDQFDKRPILYWILKDLAACNAIGFDTWYRSSASSAARANLQQMALKAFALSSFTMEGLSRALYAARYIILIAIVLLALHVMLQNHARSTRIAAEEIKSAIHQHAKTVDQAIVDHGFVTDRALRLHGKQIEAASINIATSINVASANTVLEVRAAAKTIESGMSRQGASINMGLRYQGDRMQKVLEYKNRQELPEVPPDARLAQYDMRQAKLGIMNSGVSVLGGVLGVVGAAAAVGCTVM
ncbi:hypothetical protein MMC28_009017 [Mycoblastus sanguinarius]|nr:hypothetical protein [Mycoblastus sanguinarius]